jgi:hypothetical protein
MSIRQRERVATSLLSALLGARDAGMIAPDEPVLVLSEVFVRYMRDNLAPADIEAQMKLFIDSMVAKAAEIADLSGVTEWSGMQH